jgi:hypothetical protein
MIDALISIIDRLIQLTKYRADRLRTVFTELFEPLFNDLLMVHGDYIGMFQHTLDCLPWNLTAEVWDSKKITPEDRREAFRKAIEQLRARRKQFAPIRAKIRAISDELKPTLEKSTPEVRGFVDAVLSYFPRGDVDPSRTGWPSPAIVMIEFLEEKLQFDDDLAADRRIYEHARSTVELSIRTHEEGWSRLCIAFAKLKVAVAAKP